MIQYKGNLKRNVTISPLSLAEYLPRRLSPAHTQAVTMAITASEHKVKMMMNCVRYFSFIARSLSMSAS